MFQRRLFSVSRLLVIVALLLTACATATEAPPAATSTPLPVPPTYTPIPAKPAATATSVPTEAPKPTDTSAPAAIVNAWGVTLPEDAAPL